jgi:hypothetical protein
MYISDNGRTFFSTSDPLVPKDTDHVLDVYEYTDGRPQLITSGISATATRNGGAEAGFIGVSADGVNAYFSTYDSLVPQDENGPFLKFYDARSGGGFATPPLNPPCEAADECHGADTSPPASAAISSEGDLGSGGNFSPPSTESGPQKHKKHKKHHKRRKHRKHHNGRANHQGGGK